MAIMNDFSQADNMMEQSLAASTETNFLTYIKPVWLGEGTGYAVCTEDGVELAIFSSHDAAFYSARQHNLSPSSLN